jgi:hypothetical protein
MAREFFPLTPDSVWTYRVNSKSQHSTYVVTDKAVGEKYVPSLNITGEVVEEYYNMDRGGTRPIYTSPKMAIGPASPALTIQRTILKRQLGGAPKKASSCPRA